MPSPAATSLDIRLARADDSDAVFVLLGQLWPKSPLDREVIHTAFLKGISDPGRSFFVGELGGRVVALATLAFGTDLWQPAFKAAHLDELVVDAAVRGQGVGEAMLQHIVEAARQRGLTMVELISAAHRTDAHAFYERKGFPRLGTLVFGRKL